MIVVTSICCKNQFTKKSQKNRSHALDIQTPGEYYLEDHPIVGLFPFQMGVSWLINGGDPNHLQVLG